MTAEYFANQLAVLIKEAADQGLGDEAIDTELQMASGLLRLAWWKKQKNVSAISPDECRRRVEKLLADASNPMVPADRVAAELKQLHAELKGE